jgi:hypothetical protein
MNQSLGRGWGSPGGARELSTCEMRLYSIQFHLSTHPVRHTPLPQSGVLPPNSRSLARIISSSVLPSTLGFSPSPTPPRSFSLNPAFSPLARQNLSPIGTLLAPSQSTWLFSSPRRWPPFPLYSSSFTLIRTLHATPLLRETLVDHVSLLRKQSGCHNSDRTAQPNLRLIQPTYS